MSKVQMTPAHFLRIVLLLWGDHWQKPCLALLAKHGHRYTRQTLWNWKTGNSPVPEHVELLLEQARKAKRSVSSHGIPSRECAHYRRDS
jgi:hypothetical protein